jgi:hypothetical protein
LRSVCSKYNVRVLGSMLAVAMLLGLATASAVTAAEESLYTERVIDQQATPPVQSIQESGEWLPACSPPIVIGAVFKQNHEIHVVGYVKRSMIGRTLKLQSRLAGGRTVLKFKPRSNGYFNVTTARPRHKVANSAAWRVKFGKTHTRMVKLNRPLVLNNVHQRKGLLMVSGQLNVPARDDTVVAVQRLDDCHSATRIGQVGLPPDGFGALNGPVPLRDLFKPVATFVRLRTRVREPGTGAWGKSFWSLPLPIVLKP